MGGETKLFSLRAFDPQAEIGLIEWLLDPKIGGSGDISHFREQGVRVAPVCFQIVSDDLNIKRGGQSEIENLPDHVGGQESERNARELFRKRQTKLVNVVGGRMMLDGQTHKNVGVRAAHRRGIAVGEIDTAVGQANVVNHVLNFTRGDLAANRPLDLIAKVGGLFNAHSGGSTHMKLERSGINAGKEVAAQPGNQEYQRSEAAGKECDQEITPVMETNFQQSAITLTKFFEDFFKTLLQPDQGIAAGGISRFFFLVSPQKVLGHCLADGPRKEMGRQHGKNHCFREWHEEVSCYAGQ